MHLYVVSIHIQKAAESRWVAWMTETHIPEVLDTGLFHGCRMFRSELQHREGYTTYRMHYTLKSRQAFDTYEKVFAPALRNSAPPEFTGRFTAERDLLEMVEE
ncbi:protein of unknown function (DUF4286) [Cyclonatronum proteinivorum]|uniref:DUF4286 family protein n=1 Tax=Cyclonatronum proteinivorum TaxID=1457365 RepID=A0A345UIR0_9BACT|nr:DUF4286 family protein [Cyclonatronum proteinivorum]AXJ00362.1 protein of unknown function (DUF4286) [Cyclonatronum proteinivorum]